MALLPWVLVAFLLSVGSAQAAIIITGANIKNGTVTGADVRNGSLGAGELSVAARRSLVDTSPWEKIPSGRTVVGSFQTTYRTVANGAPHVQTFQLPALPPEPLIGANAVNFGATSGVADADPACTGSFAEPSAPAGKVCVYPLYLSNLGPITAGAYAADTSYQELGVFNLSWSDAYDSVTGFNVGFAITWAYTAP